VSEALEKYRDLRDHLADGLDLCKVMPEYPVKFTFTATPKTGDVCSHGSLRRSCEVCERDERDAEMEDENERLTGQVNAWAERRHASWCCGPGEMCCVCLALATWNHITKDETAASTWMICSMLFVVAGYHRMDVAEDSEYKEHPHD